MSSFLSNGVCSVDSSLLLNESHKSFTTPITGLLTEASVLLLFSKGSVPYEESMIFDCNVSSKFSSLLTDVGFALSIVFFCFRFLFFVAKMIKITHTELTEKLMTRTANDSTNCKVNNND